MQVFRSQRRTLHDDRVDPETASKRHRLFLMMVVANQTTTSFWLEARFAEAVPRVLRANVRRRSLTDFGKPPTEPLAAAFNRNVHMYSVDEYADPSHKHKIRTSSSTPRPPQGTHTFRSQVSMSQWNTNLALRSTSTVLTLLTANNTRRTRTDT